MLDDIGNKIKALRTGRQLTQDQLAKLINKKFNANISKSMISKWENNKEIPTLENVRMLVSFLGCTLDYLIGIDVKEENQLTTTELIAWFKANKEKLSSLSKEDSQKIIKLIDLYLD